MIDLMGLHYCPKTGIWSKWWKKYKFDHSRLGEITCKCHGYLVFRRKGVSYKLHRLAFQYMGIEIPEGMQVDHINGNRSDNRWCNLRIVTASENSCNQKIHRDGRHPYIRFHKGTGKWEVRKWKNRKYYYYGLFKTESEAIQCAKDNNLIGE